MTIPHTEKTMLLLLETYRSGQRGVKSHVVRMSAPLNPIGGGTQHYLFTVSPKAQATFVAYQRFVGIRIEKGTPSTPTNGVLHALHSIASSTNRFIPFRRWVS